MILIFLIFTIFTIFLRLRESRSIQESIPFLIVSIISWISFLFYIYLDNEYYLLATYEITSFVIILLFGIRLERFFQLKFLGFFFLSLVFIFGGIFKQEILFMYVVLSTIVALSSNFLADSKVKYPFIQFNIISLMKAREFITSPVAVDVFLIAMAFLLIFLIVNKCRKFSSESIFIMTILWLGVFTFSINVYFLLLAIFLLLLISLLEVFKIGLFRKKEDLFIYIVSLIITIPLARASLTSAMASLAIFTFCLFINRRMIEGEEL
ncbi:hypothetical protein [Halobacteriovorax sp. JY17]|uniref:hypothetical protein n=1 Tax=Halobacteriovorax sp. JY17 TaxID=2014617 RepID=UPI000C3E6C1D|nr:hypothetical protein [Halobacteriovorax sp. JY17]PIK14367.1 MAG: hypothetical protein CES88_08450 [Halobacteriovorax sp. JY17]